MCILNNICFVCFNYEISYLPFNIWTGNKENNTRNAKDVCRKNKAFQCDDIDDDDDDNIDDDDYADSCIKNKTSSSVSGQS